MKPRAYILLWRRGHATPHMPVETAKCWWLLKIEPNAWAGGKGSCAVCVDLQAVGALEFFGELYSLAKGFGPFLRGVWAGFREREGSILVTTSTLPSLQAYAELHALFSEGVYKPLMKPGTRITEYGTTDNYCTCAVGSEDSTKLRWSLLFRSPVTRQ